MRLAFAAALVAPALAAGVSSSAWSAVRAYPVAGFDRVQATGPFDVRVHTGAGPAVRATGDQAVIDRLTVEVRGGALLIGARPGNWMSGWSWGRRTPLVIDVAVPALRAVSLKGSGGMSVDRVRAPRFEAEVTGTGDLRLPELAVGTLGLSLVGTGEVTVAGRALTVAISSRGTGDVDARGLLARDATVSVRGTGGVTAAAQRSATVALSGTGDVTILGHPRCSVVKHGTGDVHCG